MGFLFLVSGYSGSGKDEVCRTLIEKFKCLQLGMTDPARRHMMELYGWSQEQLFGPSAFRNAGDPKLPNEFFQRVSGNEGNLVFDPDLSNEAPEVFTQLREHMKKFPSSNDFRRFFLVKSENVRVDKKNMVKTSQGLLTSDCDPQFFLSPREALQKYCELMNTMYEPTWIRSVVETIREVNSGDYGYYRERGLFHLEQDEFPSFGEEGVMSQSFCLADLRHWHEIRYTREHAESAGVRPVFIRVKRPSVPEPPFNHRSETEQQTIPDSEFDFVIQNDGTLEELAWKVQVVISNVQSR